jgi:esterase/lipase superfamily enzyme
MPTGRAPALIILACALAVSGCGANQASQLLAATAVAASASAIQGRHEIFVATTRAKSQDTLEVYSGMRSPKIDFASVDMTVPAIHKTGEIERRGAHQPADPSRFFVANSLTAYSPDAFETALKRDIAGNGGRALVFIHGYNTAFDAAVYRMTQLVHDAGYRGTPLLFTWASGGKTVDYVYDSNSASAARDALEATLRMVAKAGAKRIDIVAHSMGTWVTMEALRQLAIGKDRDLGNRLGDVVLASPDIDVDVFKAQMRRYGKPDKPFAVMLSSDDRALRLSSILAGNRPRVGGYDKPEELAELGVIVVDLSEIAAGDRLNHSKFADNPVLVKILGDRLQHPDDDRDETALTNRIGALTQNVGETVGSAAAIVITTPFEVMRIAVGG